MQHSSDMVERVARALADICHCGACTYEDRIEDAQAAIEASHHAELVEALRRSIGFARALVRGHSVFPGDVEGLDAADDILAKIGGGA